MRRLIIRARLLVWLCLAAVAGGPLPIVRAQADTIWYPPLHTTWQWQLSGTVNQTVNAQMYDIDGFDNAASVVTALHNQGRHVVCYISLGTWENWRPDANQFPASVLGNPDGGWPGEKWLDIRRIDILGPIMQHRLDMCKAKGFDALEPDNIDGYANDSGFSLTAQDQITYNRWIATQAHARGLSVGLKNDSDQVAALVGNFDWALTEDCFAQGWCYQLSPFVQQGKAVFSAEYTDTGAQPSHFCPRFRQLQFNGIYKRRDLGAWRGGCPPL